MSVAEHLVRLFEVSLVTTILGTSCSPGPSGVLWLMPFLDISIRFPIVVCDRIWNCIVSVSEQCYYIVILTLIIAIICLFQYRFRYEIFQIYDIVEQEQPKFKHFHVDKTS